MTTLNNWYTAPDNPYAAPEQGGGIHLVGNVTGHPRFPDGHQVETTTIASAVGRVATTGSGTVYTLGRPSGKWLAWLKKNGKTYDSKQPIKIHGDT